MKHNSIIVRADWDSDAQVWVATSADVEGLCVEAETLEKLAPKVLGAISDLAELNGLQFETDDIPVHIMAEQLTRLHLPKAS